MRLFRVAYSCPICASITRKYTTYLIVAGEVPGDGRNMHKNCEDQARSSGDVRGQTNTQTKRQRDTLITILRSPIVRRVIISHQRQQDSQLEDEYIAE